MGKIIKINMFSEAKRKTREKLNLKVLEEHILKYNNWLKKTNKEDRIESYEKFLQAERSFKSGR